MDPRREKFSAFIPRTLDAVNGRRVVYDALRTWDGREPVYVAAVGKAAGAMAQGAADALGERWARGLVITRHGHLPSNALRLANTDYRTAGHPLPDGESLLCGEALVRFVAEVPHATRLLILMSGGASSLVEQLPAGVSFEDWQRVNQWLLGSGFDIHHMNAVRKSLSCIKAGRLAVWTRDVRTDVLLMSDVPGDDRCVIGSGLLVADDAAVVDQAALTLPAWMRTLLHHAPKFPESSDRCFQNISTRIVARNADARAALAAAAQQLGIAATNYSEEFTGSVAQAATVIREALQSGAKGIHIWGGEPTLVLPEVPGWGGRNSHLALTVAQHIDDRRDVLFLALATDGSDGNSAHAGALVDGMSLSRGRKSGFDAAVCLARADSMAFLDASGDALTTGPTGTNVMDLMVGWVGS